MKNLFTILISLLILTSCQSDHSSKDNTLEDKTSELKKSNQEHFSLAKEDGLQLLCSTDNSYYFIDKPRENLYLYTELKADSFSNTAKERFPLNLSIVIDRSGSMSGEKLQYAKEAAIYAVKQMNPKDRISVVSYGSNVTVVLKPTKVINQQDIINKILAIQSNGGTFLSGGMNAGFDLVKKHYNKEYINRVFLLSDGLANEGQTNKTTLTDIASNIKEINNISLSTFGIGLDFNEDLMTELAEAGGGNYYFIDEAKEISTIFQKELNGLSSLVAKDVKMQIAYPKDMLKIIKVYGYKYKDIDSGINIDFSDIFSKETKAIIIKFSIKELVAQDIIFTTKVNFTSTVKAENSAKEILMVNTISPSKNIETVNKNINNFTMRQAILFESNDAIEQAARELDNRNYAVARTIIKANEISIQKNIKKYGKSKELNNLSISNTTYQDEIKDYENKSVREQKYIQKNKKEESYKIRKKKFYKK